MTSTVHRLPEHHGPPTVEALPPQRQDGAVTQVSKITPPGGPTDRQAIQKNTQVIRFSSSVAP